MCMIERLVNCIVPDYIKIRKNYYCGDYIPDWVKLPGIAFPFQLLL